MVAAHTFQIPLLQADDEVVVLGIPVVEGRDVQAAVEAVELVLFVLQFLVGRVGEENDPGGSSP